MIRKVRSWFLTLFLLGIVFGTAGQCAQIAAPNRPIIILTVDKLDSGDLFHSSLSGIRRLLSESSSGLLNVRAGNGYSSSSGYLSVGTGNRAEVPEKPLLWVNDLKWLIENPDYAQSSSDMLWDWMGSNLSNNNSLSKDGHLQELAAIPEIGLLKNDPENLNRGVSPGLLGSIMRRNGWKTYLIGDQGNKSKISAPGLFLIMDNRGVIDKSFIGNDFNAESSLFPYHSYFNNEKALDYLRQNLGPRKIMVVDFADFARLDAYRNEMMPERYAALKNSSMKRFDQFIRALVHQWSVRDVNLIILSPSISQEGMIKKNLLAPIVIRADGYPKGLTFSGTTKWPGLVANIDILPTILHMSGLKTSQSIPGRLIKTIRSPKHLGTIDKLAKMAVQSTVCYRPLIDWYLGLISIGWITFLLLYGIKQKLGAGWLLTYLAVAPLALLVLPLLPGTFWNVSGFTAVNLILTIPLLFCRNLRLRFFILSLGFWVILIGDQFTGWYLGRFSALGYGSTGGARYYGMGNEYMGIFLALAILISEWLVRQTRRKWPSMFIFAMTVLILGWPQLGINFGGMLAAIFGIGFYLCHLFGIRLQSRKFWMGVLGVGLIIVAIGWWDSARNPEVQTHLGRFFKNIFQDEWGQIFQVIGRKITMNLKLIVSSPWTRILILSLLTGVARRLIFKDKLVDVQDQRVWFSVLAVAFGAFIFNDSGVIAMATCLAYAWTVFLGKYLDKKMGERGFIPV